MQIAFDEVYDLIERFKLRAEEEEWTATEVLDLLENELSAVEAERF